MKRTSNVFGCFFRCIPASCGLLPFVVAGCGDVSHKDEYVQYESLQHEATNSIAIDAAVPDAGSTARTSETPSNPAVVEPAANLDLSAAPVDATVPTAIPTVTETGDNATSVPATAVPVPSANLAPQVSLNTGAAVTPASAAADLTQSPGTVTPAVAAGDGTATIDGAALPTDAAPSEPLVIQLLIPEKSFRPEKATDALRVSYDDVDLLKVLNMEPVPTNAVEYFPEWLKSLDGAKIRIRGFMYPTFQASGLEAFTLARDNGICCFVREPKIYDIIGIELAPGVTTEYIEGKPFDVEGIFRIQPESDETELYRLYRIENARVLR